MPRSFATRFFCIFIALFVTIPLHHAWGKSNPDIDKKLLKNTLLKLEKKYAGQTFEIEFSQSTRLAALDMVDTAFGTALFSYPGKMKWEYKEPEQTQYITNGKTLWVFRPRENQVMTASAGTFFQSGGGGSFLSDISRIRKDNEIRLKENTQTYIDIELLPIKKTGDITSIIVRISKDKDEITKVVTYNDYDDSTTLEFSSTRFTHADPKVFEFDIPDGISPIPME